MKTKILTLIFLITTILTFSQTPEHLSFKGVPINGTLDEYVLKMKQNGFSHLSKEDGTAILKADFAGYKDCIVGVSTLKQKDLVHKIAVIFPERETWSTLFGNYSNLKEMLTEKYGKPTNIIEKFDRIYEPKDDSSKMYEVKFDRCKYYSIWETNKGDIQLSIDHNNSSSCFIKLAYFDKINSATVKKQAIDDL